MANAYHAPKAATKPPPPRAKGSGSTRYHLSITRKATMPKGCK